MVPAPALPSSHDHNQTNQRIAVLFELKVFV